MDISNLELGEETAKYIIKVMLGKDKESNMVVTLPKDGQTLFEQDSLEDVANAISEFEKKHEGNSLLKRIYGYKITKKVTSHAVVAKE